MSCNQSSWKPTPSILNLRSLRRTCPRQRRPHLLHEGVKDLVHRVDAPGVVAVAVDDGQLSVQLGPRGARGLGGADALSDEDFVGVIDPEDVTVAWSDVLQFSCHLKQSIRKACS